MPTDNDYERLGSALSEKLHATSTPVDPSPGFEARLARALAIARAEQSVSHRRRWALSALLPPAVASGVAALLLFAVSDSSPAFAVTRGSDGTVEITLNDIAGVSGANANLRDLGVTNVVVVPIEADCTTQIAMSYLSTGSSASSTVTVTPAEIPVGTTTVLAAKQTSQGQIEEAIGKVSDPAPTCVAPAPASINGAPTGPATPHAPAPMNTAGNS